MILIVPSPVTMHCDWPAREEWIARQRRPLHAKIVHDWKLQIHYGPPASSHQPAHDSNAEWEETGEAEPGAMLTPGSIPIPTAHFDAANALARERPRDFSFGPDSVRRRGELIASVCGQTPPHHQRSGVGARQVRPTGVRPIVSACGTGPSGPLRQRSSSC
jgi:hypothetical protein